MKKLILLTFIFLVSCSQTQKVSSQDSKKERKRVPASVSTPSGEFFEEIENAPARRY